MGTAPPDVCGEHTNPPTRASRATAACRGPTRDEPISCLEKPEDPIMSIFGRIYNAIFGSAKAADAPAPAAGGAPATGGASAQPMTREQVEAKIQKIADDTGRKNYDWKQSIVDLMKLLDLDSSLAARKELAQELGYTGKLDGSAEMNVWLHKQVMSKLMASGGTVPDSLR
jgi:hypothetical protein